MHGFKFFMMKHTKFASKSVEGKTAISIKKSIRALNKRGVCKSVLSSSSVSFDYLKNKET